MCGAQRAPPLPPVGRDTTVDQRSLSRSRSRRSRGEPERLSLPRACRGLSGVLPLCARGALAAPLASAHLLLPSLHTDGHGTRGGADCGDCGCGGLRRQGPTRVWPGSGRPALARVSAGPSRLHLTAHNAKPHSFRALPRCVRAAHMDTSNFTNNELECLVRRNNIPTSPPPRGKRRGNAHAIRSQGAQAAELLGKTVQSLDPRLSRPDLTCPLPCCPPGGRSRRSCRRFCRCTAAATSARQPRPARSGA